MRRPHPPDFFSLWFVFLTAGLWLTGLVGCSSTPPPPLEPSARGAERGLLQWAADSETLEINVRGAVLQVQATPPLLEELSRIPGAVIAFVGRSSGSRVEVRRYRMVEAEDGTQPWVGRLVVDQGGVSLRDEATGVVLGLQGKALSRLKRLHGARLWLTGGIVGPHLLLVTHWGIIQPAPSTPEGEGVLGPVNLHFFVKPLQLLARTKHHQPLLQDRQLEIST